jgi:hypothetical protein
MSHYHDQAENAALRKENATLRAKVLVAMKTRA